MSDAKFSAFGDGFGIDQLLVKICGDEVAI